MPRTILSIFATLFILTSFDSAVAQQKQDPRNDYLYCITGSLSCFLTPAECENENRFHTGKSCQPVACGTGATHGSTALCAKAARRGNR